MAYCTKCGARLPDDSMYCPSCGSRVGAAGPEPDRGYAPPAQEYSPREDVIILHDKSEGIAAVLSFLVPGLGQIYVGKIGRGIGLLFMLFVLWFAMIMLIAMVPEATLLILALFLCYYVYCIYDAYKLARDYNEYMVANRRKPW